MSDWMGIQYPFQSSSGAQVNKHSQVSALTQHSISYLINAFFNLIAGNFERPQVLIHSKLAFFLRLALLTSVQ